MTSWCIAFSRPAAYKRIQENCLNRLGLEVYVPLIHFERSGNGWRTELCEDKPVFPGYLFVPQEHDWERLRDIPDVFGFLMRLNDVVSLPESLIDEIKLNVLSGVYEANGMTVKRYVVGALVKVECGHFANEIGIITRLPEKKNPKVLLRGTIEATIPKKNLLLI
jgi:transcription antitermination factor NusG